MHTNIIYIILLVLWSAQLIVVIYCRYRVSLFARWKQRGMYATCMWVVQLLLVLSDIDSLFLYIPEFYLEALVCYFCCSFFVSFRLPHRLLSCSLCNLCRLTVSMLYVRAILHLFLLEFLSSRGLLHLYVPIIFVCFSHFPLSQIYI